MSAKKIQLPLTEDVIGQLQAGEPTLLTGILYTARDAAHQRLKALLEVGEALPIDLRGQAIYYCGPAPTPPGRPIGSCGPTSSYRMDPFTPMLYSCGLKATIGKGERCLAVRKACQDFSAIYFVAAGGAGALLASRVIEAEIVAWPELGPEAIWRLVVQDFPVIVAYDAHGGSCFPHDKPLSLAAGEQIA